MGATEKQIANIEAYVRAANYLSAAQIYLQDNFLLEHPLTPEDIKPRLLGHWGTCPGINFIYAHLNHLIRERNLEMMFILGPGHGFPALQANLYLEGTLANYYPEADHTLAGLTYLAKNFSWPYGFPSHSNPGAPGVILEGGELGYSLATAYGAVLDNPDLIVACVVGDGEAETGAAATAWHASKLIDPRGNGAVLPILHLNEYKISGPSLYGRMSDDELEALFNGYGYEPIIVGGKDIYKKMKLALGAAADAIAGIQEEARSRATSDGPYRFPMIILRTPKGWTGIKELHGEKLEGNYLSHQVIAKEAKTDAEDLVALEAWLRSYKFEELFDKRTGFNPVVAELVPPAELRMGDTPHARSGAPGPTHRRGGPIEYRPLLLPEVETFSEDATVPGTIGSSSMRRAGLFLNEVFKLNEPAQNFRLFSPDETYSNKLDDVFATTNRAFVLPKLVTDKNMTSDGRVMEMLSEHTLQGLMQGYVLTGRHGIFASYEAFVQVVASMADQYAKFLKIARETEWRGDVPSFNYILTSSGWRQEHNGFSHQNPGFIESMLNKQGCFVRVYFPPDGNSMLAVLKRCLASRNEINIIVAGKTLEPRWLTVERAEEELVRGLMTWEFASDPDPDLVLAAAGDYMTKEALAALSIVKRETPEIRLRFVNILELGAMGIGNRECVAPASDFTSYFTAEKPVIVNFHGYPQTIKQLLFDYGGDTRRFSVHGYIENGSTTTPFDMQVRNLTDRYHLAIEVFQKMGAAGRLTQERARELEEKYERKLVEHGQYIREHGVDPDEIEQWQWQPISQ